jgi:hypothetical protein
MVGTEKAKTTATMKTTTPRCVKEYRFISLSSFFLMVRFYENLAEYPAIFGGDECDAGVREMQSPQVFQEAPPFKEGSFTRKLDIYNL